MLLSLSHIQQNRKEFLRMKQMHQQRNTAQERNTTKGGVPSKTRKLHGNRQEQAKPPLNMGQIHIAPWLSMFLGGAGVIVGFVSNGWQVFTSASAFLIMLLTNNVYLSQLKKDPTKAAGLIPTFNSSSWFLAICIQVGVLFFTLRVDHEFKEQLAMASSSQHRFKQATKSTAVQIAHNRDFLFYYGILCFIANCLGDYGFVQSFTDSLEFLLFWGVVLTATSTMILALGGEFLWAGYRSFKVAQAEWSGNHSQQRPQRDRE